MHKSFPLFHNGITIISKSVGQDNDSLSISDYFVVNGCQSVTALHINEKSLTDDLRVLVKVIVMDPRSVTAAQITEYSNNQNGVKPRDFKSNNPTQIRLQNEFATNYAGQFHFEIKTGENPTKGAVISNELAGLQLMAFDLKRPWATHRKYVVFEDSYADLFGRPEVTAHRIAMLHTIMEAVQSALPKIKNEALARYRLTQYMLLYFVREILETEPLGEAMLAAPEAFVKVAENRLSFRKCVDRIVSDAVVDLNYEVKDLGADFEYRDKLRDEKAVKAWAAAILSNREKALYRASIKTFEQDWKEAQQ